MQANCVSFPKIHYNTAYMVGGACPATDFGVLDRIIKCHIGW